MPEKPIDISEENDWDDSDNNVNTDKTESHTSTSSNMGIQESAVTDVHTTNCLGMLFGWITQCCNLIQAPRAPESEHDDNIVKDYTSTDGGSNNKLGHAQVEEQDNSLEKSSIAKDPEPKAADKAQERAAKSSPVLVQPAVTSLANGGTPIRNTSSTPQKSTLAHNLFQKETVATNCESSPVTEQKGNSVKAQSNDQSIHDTATAPVGVNSRIIVVQPANPNSSAPDLSMTRKVSSTSAVYVESAPAQSKLQRQSGSKKEPPRWHDYRTSPAVIAIEEEPKIIQAVDQTTPEVAAINDRAVSVKRLSKSDPTHNINNTITVKVRAESEGRVDHKNLTPENNLIGPNQSKPILASYALKFMEEHVRVSVNLCQNPC
jgi:hypothetical protein